MNDGVGLAVEVVGDGPGLMLLHGLGGAKEDFADHVPTLARDHTVVTFDHRGHGESDNPTDPAAYSLERMVADSLAVADATGLDHFRLLGHSMGGMVARKIAIQEPSRIDALGDDGHVGRTDSGLRRRTDGHRGRCRAHAGQAGAQGIDGLRERVGDARVQARRRGASRFCRVRGAQVGRHVGDHVGHDGPRARVSIRRLARLGRVAARATPRTGRIAGQALRHRVGVDRRSHPERAARRDSRRRPFTAVRESDRLDRRAHRFPQRTARDPR